MCGIAGAIAAEERNFPEGRRAPGVVVVPCQGLREGRTGGKLVWRDIVDRCKESGLPVLSEDEIPVPGFVENKLLLLAAWYASAYRKVDRGVLVVDQSNGQRLAIMARLLKLRPRVRMVAVVHHLRERFRYRNQPYERLARWHESAFLRLADRVVVHTRDAARQVKERGVASDRIRVIALGVRSRGKTVSRMSLSPDQPLRVLWVGGDFKRKGLEVLLRAVSSCGEPRPHLTVCGRPEGRIEMQWAESLVSRYGLESVVRFCGFVPPEEMESFWLEHDVYVQPSLHEGHGMALDEALIRGMPAIASDLPVFRERIPEQAVRFVPVEDVHALVTALDSVRSDDERDRLSREALALAQGFPTWKDTLDDYETLIREELERVSRD